MNSFIENVYLSLQGLLVESASIANVENMFEDGKECERSYSEMLNAYSRLCDRLGVKGEDPNVEIIIHALMNICDKLCYRMYEYGAKFGMTQQ